MFKKTSFGSRNVRPKKEVTKEDSDQSDDTSSSSDDETKIQTLKRKRKSNPLVQRTKTFMGLSSKGKESNSDDDGEDEPIGSMSYKSNRSTVRQGPSDMGATAVVEIDTDTSRDARAIAEKALQLNQDRKGTVCVDNKDQEVYLGKANYAKFILPKESSLGSVYSSETARGPVRAPANLRATVRWDYKPDICKDYKETGFCGFGDSCIFLHDRTDYKSGWQIEMEVANGTYGKQDSANFEDGIEEKEMIPFKCLICRNSFTNPVVTKCKHYFCEKCALSSYRKSTKCAVCGAQTNGIFNPATEIARRLKQQAIEKDEKGSDSDSDSHDDDEDKHEVVEKEEDEREDPQPSCSGDHHRHHGHQGHDHHP